MDVAGRQLAAIAGITEMLEHAGIEYWLFGGWAVDFYLGEATRSHGDVDFAVRSRDRAAIGELLNSDRWLHARWRTRMAEPATSAAGSVWS